MTDHSTVSQCWGSMSGGGLKKFLYLDSIVPYSDGVLEKDGDEALK